MTNATAGAGAPSTRRVGASHGMLRTRSSGGQGGCARCGGALRRAAPVEYPDGSLKQAVRCRACGACGRELTRPCGGVVFEQFGQVFSGGGL